MKLLYITPHLSTGGCPQYLLKKIKDLKNACEIYCVEYADITGGKLIVQRSQIQELLGDKLITLQENKFKLIEYIDQIQPDVVHFEELPEYFLDINVGKLIYNKNRKYKIIETSHDSSFNVDSKVFFPDRFIFVSDYQKQLFSKLNIPSNVVEYPIEYKVKKDRVASLINLGLDPKKIHVLNIGLFTPRKNQSEIINYAKKMIDYPIQFHFVGNQADNFKWYWEPLMKDFPENCTWWGERKDVDSFYNAMDIFLFTSKGTNADKETNPLVIRESIGWNIPLLMYNLPVYCGMYDQYKNITWLDDEHNNIKIIKKIVELSLNFKTNVNETNLIDFEKYFNVWFEKETNKIYFNYQLNESNFFNISIKDIDSNVPIYHFKSNFENKINWWTMPIPKHVFDFEKESTFRGFLIELYDENKNFICSKEFIIKNVINTKNKFDFKNPFDCLFFNYYEMFVYKRYDSYNLNQKDVVIDIGANAGLFTKLCLDSGVKKVYSIEPNKRSLENLNYIFKNDHRVTVIDKAVHTECKKIIIYSNPINSTISSVNKNHIVNEGFETEENEVDTITISELIKFYNLNKISLLKMDIEGAEYEIFNKLESDVFEKIDSFLIEFHDNYENKIELIIQKLKNNGFDIDQIRLHGKNNENIINDYVNHANGTIYAIKSKMYIKDFKVKILHLQTTLNDDREKKSRESLMPLSNCGFEYKLHKNEIYKSLPPTHNCFRPNDVGDGKNRNNPNLLTPAHYGCFESFKLGILSEFDADLDFLIVCEGDCLLEVSPEMFKEIVYKIIAVVEQENIGYFSFGDKNTLETNILQSTLIENIEGQNLCYITDKIIGIQCIMFPKKIRETLKEYLRTSKWDAADIYFNIFCSDKKLKRAILFNRITTQCDGYSTIDNNEKIFTKHNV